MERLSSELKHELSRFGVQAGLAELVERWPGVVGAGIARNAWPARIARDGTLHVATADSVWAFELGHRAVEIAGRLEEYRRQVGVYAEAVGRATGVRARGVLLRV